jgi:hypothetical protein
MALALLTFASPSGQVRGVKALATKQSADGAGLSGDGIEFSKDALLVLAGEGWAPGVGDDLRVWSS